MKRKYFHIMLKELGVANSDKKGGEMKTATQGGKMKAIIEIEWPHADLSMPDYQRELNNLRTMGFVVRELPAAPEEKLYKNEWECPKCKTINGNLNKVCRYTPCGYNPASGSIPVRSVGFLNGLENEKLGKEKR